MMKIDLSQAFERALVDLVCQLAEDQGLNYAQFAKKAYGDTYDEQSAVVKWRRQRREDNPQSVSIANAYLLAQGLGMELPDLIFRTQAKLRMTE
ncbi:hypothetical protein ACR42D_10075 [Desulfovibrio caledoniensis]